MSTLNTYNLKSPDSASTNLALDASGNVAIQAGSASAPSIYVTGDANTGIYSPGADQVAVTTGGSARLYINSSGNVGIGVTGPSYPLTVKGSIGLGVASNGTVELSFDNSIVGDALTPAAAIQGLYTAYGSTSAGALIFKTNSAAANATEKARIDSSGRLLVGTSTTVESAALESARFQVSGTDNGSAQVSISRFSNNDASSRLVFIKSRGSAGSNTIVQNGDSLGTIVFQGADGSGSTAYLQGAIITANVDGTPGTGDLPTRLVFFTTADGASSPTERMRIGSNGELLTFSDTNQASYTWRNGSTAGTSIPFVTALYGASSTTSGGTISLRIWTNGNIQNTNNSYTAISDIKLKENIVDAGSQWDDLKALRVRKYNLKEGQTHTQIGLVAQEVEPISPGLVYETPDCDPEGNDLGTVTKSVNYSVLYMKSVKALQEAMERIETLEAKVAALESA